MNKFNGPDDPGYVAVAAKIQILIDKIREGSPLKRADDWIRDNHYTADRLKIQRLSGCPLPMDQCYINLAIVEDSSKKGVSDRGSAERNTASSPFSMLARLKIETPDSNIQVELPTLFNSRKGSNWRMRQPKRVLIRGRAGVGKTTLCKKIVHDFTQGTWGDLFDRVLWVPLRELKDWSPVLYNLEELFSHEYFTHHPSRDIFAKELLRIVDSPNGGRTLFLLDGLDEISQALGRDDHKSDLLRRLLYQPNVITTSRPYGPLPYWLKGTFDLELEAVGFYPDQVKDYIKEAFTSPETREADSKKADKVQSFLQKHQLIQGLVRIPIILDALCYTWDDFEGKTIPQTMTAIYQAIEQRLWKKDFVKLERGTQAQMQDARSREIMRSVQVEIYILEVLAFTGMHNDVIDFEPKHRDAIKKHISLRESNF
jgi:hypothetical protein